ncbi:MAG: transglycosylase SLT domain-containing protein [Candidatus Dormibacteria bacterium]
MLTSATQPTAATNAVTVSRTDPRALPVAEPNLQEPRKGIATPTPLPLLPAPAAAVRRPAARPRVAAPPVAAGPPANPNSVVGIIEAAAARWGVSGSWMVKIARCESGLRTNAYNPSGPYIGLFQFLRSTFTHNGGTNIYDAADQSNIAAKMLAHGQAHQWSCA